MNVTYSAFGEDGRGKSNRASYRVDSRGTDRQPTTTSAFVCAVPPHLPHHAGREPGHGRADQEQHSTSITHVLFP